jgi:hypothetical protein
VQALDRSAVRKGGAQKTAGAAAYSWPGPPGAAELPGGPAAGEPAVRPEQPRARGVCGGHGRRHGHARACLDPSDAGTAPGSAGMSHQNPDL